MKLFKGFTIAACLLVASPVFAQNTYEENYEEDQADVNVENSDREPASSPQVSEAEAEGTSDDTKIDVNSLAIRPSAGAVFYNGQERFTGGVMLDINVLSTPWARLGPSTGALFSSLSGGDFFSGVSTNNNNYFFQIPANLKVTFSPDPANRLQLGVHGGANVIRSTGTAGRFGSAGNVVATTDTGASWDVHPNVGADIDFALGDNVDLTLRPDVTFLDTFRMTTATLGLALKL